MNRPDDGRYVAEVPSGIVKSPRLVCASVDLWVNDVIYLDDDLAYPMYDESHEMGGVVISRGAAGGRVLIAT